MEVHEFPGPLAVLRADVLVRDALAGTVDLRIHLHDLTETTRWVPKDIEAGWGVGYAPRYTGAGPPTLPRLPSAVNLTITFDPDSSQATPTPLHFTLALDAQGTGVLAGLSVPHPTLWSPSSPSLHTLSVAIGGGGRGVTGCLSGLV